MTTDLATMTEYSAPLDALDEYLIPTGLHWTPQGPHGEDWVMRWNRVTGTVQARRWSHERGTGFSAEADSIETARREASRIAGLINQGKTNENREI